MKLLAQKIFLFALIIGITGCVTIFGRKKQNVKITSATPDANLSIDKKSVDNDTIKINLDKNYPHSVTASKEGYKSRSSVLSLEKISLWFFGDIAVAPAFYGVFTFVSLLIDGSTSPVKQRRFKPKVEIDSLIALPKKKSNEKYIWVEDVYINLRKGDVLGKYYLSTGKMRRDKAFDEYKAYENAIYDAPQFKHDMNEILLSYGYSDTSENVIPSSWNSLFLTSKIKKLNTKLAILRSSNDVSQRSALIKIDLDVEWTLYDGFGNEIFNAITYGTSDDAWGNVETNELLFQKSMKDAIEYAILDLYTKPEFLELIILDQGLETGKNNQVTEITRLPSNETSNKLEEQLKSIVRISSNNFNSTGVIISSDGYIITNYQIISGGKQVKVKLAEKELKADVISTNAQLNLALIKVESDSLQPINWDLTEQSEIGEQIYTLSFSRLEVLNKYVSSGIVSGTRIFQSKPYIQSDVPMSFGNSGGLMVNSNGEIIGILNAKVNSEEVEGIGFAVPMREVLSGLNIKLKQF